MLRLSWRAAVSVGKLSFSDMQWLWGWAAGSIGA
ncbi:hypothetical protein OKW12_004051 [Pseudomonas silensiensis]|nr:hypothetical protein [Pseudomonas silensiensis]